MLTGFALGHSFYQMQMHERKDLICKVLLTWVYWPLFVCLNERYVPRFISTLRYASNSVVPRIKPSVIILLRKLTSSTDQQQQVVRQSVHMHSVQLSVIYRKNRQPCVSVRVFQRNRINWMYLFVYTYIYMYIYVCVYIFTHTHTHTRIMRNCLTL